MKKLMIAAAAAAMTIVSNAAGLKPEVCTECGPGVIPGQICDTVVFKVTGSGKAVTDKGDYKAIETLKIKKGALALEGMYCATSDSCCYDGGYFYATIKAGKKTFAMAAEVELLVWSVFGKNLEKSRYYRTMIKPGKKVTLDSAMFVQSTAAEVGEDDDVDLSDFGLWASAFGKVEAKVTKGTKGSSGYCDNTPGTEGCDIIYTPKTYSGWFVGIYPCVNEDDCFLCDCTDIDIFGGTWKAVYQSKYTTDAEAMKLAGVEIAADED